MTLWVENYLYQYFLNLPFGEEMAAQHSTTAEFSSRYKYNAKELDQETRWYYYGARYYDPSVSQWLSVDPLASKNSFESPYVFVHNNPLIYVDPDGRDAILIIFPDYKVDPELKIGKWKVPKAALGHAGVLLFDNKTGLTKYYEYGRYSTSDGTRGRVRSSDTDRGLVVSNLVIDPETGKPTQASLNKVLGQISKASGQGGRIQGAYVEGDFDLMNNYAQEKLKESNPQYKEYDKDRDPYSFLGNNCGTFACDVIKQDKGAKKKAPWIFIPSPDNIGEEYQDNFPKVDYNPKTKSTTSDIYKKD